MPHALKKFFIIVRNICLSIGYDPLVIVNALRGIPTYLRDYRTLKRQLAHDDSFPFARMKPVWKDLGAPAGVMSGHYFHQDLFVAQRIFLNNPRKHVDIGSRIDGFVAHVATFRTIEVIDIRRQTSTVPHIVFRAVDMMTLPHDLLEYCDSISSLHVIEHFGLGRYGDTIDAYGHIKGLLNIYAMLKKGGTFYFSVPMGSQRILFNAHRIFSLRYLLDQFTPYYHIQSFSFIDDAGQFHENIVLSDALIVSNCNCKYGCGVFELVKI